MWGWAIRQIPALCCLFHPLSISTVFRATDTVWIFWPLPLTSEKYSIVCLFLWEILRLPSISHYWKKCYSEHSHSFLCRDVEWRWGVSKLSCTTCLGVRSLGHRWHITQSDGKLQPAVAKCSCIFVLLPAPQSVFYDFVILWILKFSFSLFFLSVTN